MSDHKEVNPAAPAGPTFVACVSVVASVPSGVPPASFDPAPLPCLALLPATTTTPPPPPPPSAAGAPPQLPAAAAKTTPAAAPPPPNPLLAGWPAPPPLAPKAHWKEKRPAKRPAEAMLVERAEVRSTTELKDAQLKLKERHVLLEEKAKAHRLSAETLQQLAAEEEKEAKEVAAERREILAVYSQRMAAERREILAVYSQRMAAESSQKKPKK